MTDTNKTVLTDDSILHAIINACDSLNITRAHEITGGMWQARTIADDTGLIQIGRAIERAVIAKLGGVPAQDWLKKMDELIHAVGHDSHDVPRSVREAQDHARIRVLPAASEAERAKLQSAYAGACEQIDRLLREKGAASEADPVIRNPLITPSEAGAVPIGYISQQAFKNFKACGQDKLEMFHSPGALRDEFEDALPMRVYAAHPAQPEKQAGQPIHVEACECSECGHIGINDSHPTNAACGYPCGWTGPSPKEDKCPGCGREGVMSQACPKCSGHYRLLVGVEVSAVPPAPSQQAGADVQPKRRYDPCDPGNWRAGEPGPGTAAPAAQGDERPELTESIVEAIGAFSLARANHSPQVTKRLLALMEEIRDWGAALARQQGGGDAGAFPLIANAPNTVGMYAEAVGKAAHDLHHGTLHSAAAFLREIEAWGAARAQRAEGEQS